MTSEPEPNQDSPKPDRARRETALQLAVLFHTASEAESTTAEVTATAEAFRAFLEGTHPDAAARVVGRCTHRMPGRDPVRQCEAEAAHDGPHHILAQDLTTETWEDGPLTHLAQDWAAGVDAWMFHRRPAPPSYHGILHGEGDGNWTPPWMADGSVDQCTATAGGGIDGRCELPPMHLGEHRHTYADGSGTISWPARTRGNQRTTAGCQSQFERDGLTVDCLADVGHPGQHHGVHAGLRYNWRSEDAAAV